MNNSKNLTAEDYDWFAIQVAVREGKYMALTRFERTIAMKLMKEKGYSSVEVGEMLRVEPAAVTKAWQRDWPFPREDIPPEVVGGRIISTNPRLTILSRDKVRKITGR